MCEVLMLSVISLVKLFIIVHTFFPLNAAMASDPEKGVDVRLIFVERDQILVSV